VLILAVIGAFFTVAVGLAINDIYNKLDNTTVRLCLVEGWQKESVMIIAEQTHVTLPKFPTGLPAVPKPCTAKPDGLP